MNSPCLNIVVEKYWKWNLERACCTPSPFPLTVDVNIDYCLWFYLTVLVGLSKMVLTTYKSLTELKIRRLGLITFSQFSEVDTTRVLSLTNSSKFTLYSMRYSILYDVPREHEGTGRDTEGVGQDMSMPLKLFLVSGSLFSETSAQITSSISGF